MAQPIGDDRFTVIFIEVTERIKRDRRQAALLTLGDELRGRSDLETIVTAAACCLADGLDVDRVGSGIVDLRDDTVDVRADWCEPGIRSVVGLHAFSSYGSYLADLRRDQTVAIDDVYADPRTSGQAKDFDKVQTRSLLNLPVSLDGHLYAIVFAHSQSLHVWTDGEKQFVQQVGDRVRTSLARQRMEDAQRILTQEMAHRMKNTLAMVQAIATQTLRQARTMEEGREAITSRLGALARAQDIMTRANFAEADVCEVAEAAIAPHRVAGDRIAIAGAPCRPVGQRALGLSLAIHELATNAAKYGALSNETGRVDMDWTATDGAFTFRWIESGGPPVVPPARRGFGSKLIERIVASYFDGEGHIDFDPAGIRFTLTGALEQPVSHRTLEPHIMAQSFDPARYAVLIVEDDALVRAEAVDLCEEAGFTTYEAKNADQAIRLLERHSDIRVLFTDVEMPGSMDGLKLAKAVRDRWPPIAIIVTSGRTTVEATDLPENGLFFAKPYPPRGIIQALNDISAGSGTEPWRRDRRGPGRWRRRRRGLPRGRGRPHGGLLRLDRRHDELVVDADGAVLLGAERVLEHARLGPAVLGVNHQHQHVAGLHVLRQDRRHVVRGAGPDRGMTDDRARLHRGVGAMDDEPAVLGGHDGVGADDAVRDVLIGRLHALHGPLRESRGRRQAERRGDEHQALLHVPLPCSCSKTLKIRRDRASASAITTT